MTRRHGAVVVGLALLAAACGGGDGADAGDGASEARSSADATPVAVDQVAASPTEDVPSALDDPSDDRFPAPLLDPGELLSGGPPPDGIPSIDEPTFLPSDDVDFLDNEEPVLALAVGDEARAYPMQILIWHEIVNDTIDGIPVAVTYCPAVQLRGRLRPASHSRW